MATGAVRNGSLSDRLIMSSPEKIAGLKAAVTELRRGDGEESIPASAVRLRCARQAQPASSWNRTCRLDTLLETPPAEVGALTAREPRRAYSTRPVAAVSLFCLRAPGFRHLPSALGNGEHRHTRGE